MGQTFEQLLALRPEWANRQKFDELEYLVEHAVQEADVAPERLRDLLLEMGVPFRAVVYERLAARLPGGALLEAARALRDDPEPSRRCQAIRLLCFGRPAGAVQPAELEVLQSYLTDASEEVALAALDGLGDLARAEPESLAKQVLAWVEEDLGAMRAYAVAALAPAWTTALGPEVLGKQRALVRSVEYRRPFLVALARHFDSVLPVLSPEAVEAGWDGLFTPAVEHLADGRWTAGEVDEDALLLRIMGLALSQRFLPALLRRAEATIGTLLAERPASLPPTLILASCEPLVANDAAHWKRQQLIRIALAGGRDTWPAEVDTVARAIGPAAWVWAAEIIATGGEPRAPVAPSPAARRWGLGMFIIEVEIFTACNLKCFNCNRSSTQAPSGEKMTVEQIRHFVDESIAERWAWEHIRLIGGEPTLHPEFAAIVEEMGRYRAFNPQVAIQVSTNGYGDKVERALAALPPWVVVGNTDKASAYQNFFLYNVAPIDLPEYADADYSRGCHVPETCGMGLSRYGYYPCGPGAAIDRVFGFDIGIKRLAEVVPRALVRQRELLCRLCGHFWSGNVHYESFMTGQPMPSVRASEQVTSPSWAKAYAEWAERKPELTLYGPDAPRRPARRDEAARLHAIRRG